MTLAVPVPTRFLFVFLLPLVAGWGGELTAQERAGESTNGKPGAVEVPLPATTWIAPSGRSIASQLQKMVSSLDRSKKYDKIESLVERTLSLHPNDWRVVFQGARIYAQLERSGYWINGGFRRGGCIRTDAIMLALCSYLIGQFAWRVWMARRLTKRLFTGKPHKF